MENTNQNTDKLLQGRDERGRFMSAQKQVDALRDRYRGLAEQVKGYQDALRGQTQAAKLAEVAGGKLLRQNQVQIRVQRQLLGTIRQQISLTRQQAKAREAAAQAARQQADIERRAAERVEAYQRTMRRAMIVGTAVAYAGYRRVRAMYESSLEAVSAFGPRVMANLRGSLGGATETAVGQFLGKIAGTSDAVRFGLNPQGLKALTSAKGQLRNFGPQGDELLSDLMKSFGGDQKRLGAFTQTMQTQGLESALRGSASQQNIGTVTSLLNMLEAQGQVDNGSADPFLSAAMKMADGIRQLDAKIEQLITTLSDKLLPVITKVADHLGNSSLGRLATEAGLLYGGSKLAGYGARRLLLGGGAGAGAGASLGRGALSLGRGAAMGLGGLVAGTTAATAGILAGALTLGGGLALGIDKYRDKEGVGAYGWHQRAKEAQAANAASSDVLLRQAQEQAAKASSPLAALRAQRLGLTAQISAANGTDTDVTGLRQQYQALTEQIRQLKSATVDQTKATVDQTTSRDRITDLQQRAKRQEGLEKVSREVGTRTDLARQAFQLSNLSPWGALGSQAQFQGLQEAIREEEQSLLAVLNNIDQGTADGRIAANEVSKQIGGLRLEAKQSAIQMREAFSEDLIGGLMHDVGTFSKVIVDRDQNLARGLAGGMLHPSIPFVTGGLTSTGKMNDPLTSKQFFQASGLADPFRTVDMVRSMPQVLPAAGSGSGSGKVVKTQSKMNLADQMGEAIRALTAMVPMLAGIDAEDSPAPQRPTSGPRNF